MELITDMSNEVPKLNHGSESITLSIKRYSSNIVLKLSR